MTYEGECKPWFEVYLRGHENGDVDLHLTAGTPDQVDLTDPSSFENASATSSSTEVIRRDNPEPEPGEAFTLLVSHENSGQDNTAYDLTYWTGCTGGGGGGGGGDDGDALDPVRERLPNTK